MDKKEADSIVIQTFQKKYDDDRFLKFIKELLDTDLNYGFADYVHPDTIYQNYITGYKVLGIHTDVNSKRIIFAAVHLSRSESRDRARVMQRNFAADLLRGKVSGKVRAADAAMIAYFDDTQEDWRLSLITLEREFAISDGTAKVNEIVSPAKRLSFLVGIHEPCHTCQKRFEELLLNESHVLTLDDLKIVFKVEAVTDDFFNEYKKRFDELNKSLESIVAEDSSVRDELKAKDISTSDFSKRLLGQIVFLYFLQKKGWLGVEPGKEWGSGPKNFMELLYKGEIIPYDNFFDDILEPLFYESLAQKNEQDYSSKFKVRIPFLNGGLFEANYDWIRTHIRIKNEIFHDIFETFDQYNFTVNEDEPLEREVAVDPEMLGKVFESLLDTTERKGKGAFYTPRYIVHYICQQTLIEYLLKHTAIPREDIELFIQKGDVLYAETIKSGVRNTGGLPQSIQENGEALDKLLADIKVADPAVGSGAFPVGMMNEIVKARVTLTSTKAFNYGENCSGRSQYDLKHHAIEYSIYGSDLEPSAVDIAKLRFWLSLVVDEENPTEIRPLPNLDNKIMVGDSLVDQFNGIPLFDSECYKAQDIEDIIELEKQRDQLTAELSGIAWGTEQERYARITKEIERIDKSIEKIQNGNAQPEVIQSLSNKKVNSFKVTKRKINTLRKLQAVYFSEQDKGEKQRLRHEIDLQIEDILKDKLEAANNSAALREFNELKKKRGKPFFLWELYFSDVFNRKNPGFDCIIGNPPYIQLQVMSDTVKKRYSDCGFSAYASTGDIYCLFYEKGWRLLRDGGCLGYITSNKWMRAGYGQKMRKFFAEKTNPLILIDLSGQKIFEEATVDVNILIYSKSENKGTTLGCALKENCSDNMSDIVKQNASVVPLTTDDSWVILSPIEQSIKRKIESLGTPLKDWDINIYRGILTGYNDAFIITGEKREEILRKCKSDDERERTAELIRPILRGRDIKRYGYVNNDLWLINVHNGIKEKGIKPVNIEEYPSVKEHLDLYYDKLLSRQDKGMTPYNLRNCAYMEDFSKQKIIYPNMTKYLPFLYDDAGYITNQKCFIITGKDMAYLTAFLNSSIFKYCFRDSFPELQGGTRELSKIFFDKIPVMKVDDITNKEFSLLVNKIQDLKKEGGDTKHLEMEVDHKLFNMYNLDENEIKEIGFIEII